MISQNISNNLNLLIATRFEIDSTLKKLKTTEHRFVQKKKWTWGMLFWIKLTDKLLKDLFS